MKNDDFRILKKTILEEKKGIREIRNLFDNLKDATNNKEREIILFQIGSLKDFMKKINESVPFVLERINLKKPLNPIIIKEKPEEISEIKKEIRKKFGGPFPSSKSSENFNLTSLERLTVARLWRRKKGEVQEKIREPSKYLAAANRFFAETSRDLLKKDTFKILEKDLIKANMDIAPVSYISSMIFTSILSAGFAFFLLLILLFFSFSGFPQISFMAEPIGLRLLKFFWIIFIVPIGTFIAMYVYPSMEKSSLENKINQELPFATIHMSTISGSLVEPSKIFSIINLTKEYPSLEKEFNKLLSSINVYGYDLVTALRNVSLNTASKKLADLFNSLATTINSGGDLFDFFNKRAQNLLFEYRLEREKYIKFSETFMDIYISVVIATPMMLMLLLMMMKIGGLGIQLSSTMISVIMILGVVAINIVFLVFLHLKQPTE